MPDESFQHKLDRVRRPRVQITYDVETGGAMKKVELPFVVGVMADLTGHPAEELKPLRDRKFTEIDGDNFDEVLRRSKPRLAINVPNRIANDNSILPIELNFESFEDFEPARIAAKVGALSSMLKARAALTHLLGKMEGNEQLVNGLASILGDRDKANKLGAALGLKPQTTDETAAASKDSNSTANALPAAENNQPQADLKPQDPEKPEDTK